MIDQYRKTPYNIRKCEEKGYKECQKYEKNINIFLNVTPHC